MSSERFVLHGEPYKTAVVWFATLHGCFFGANLFFSSREAFEKLYDGDDAEHELLIGVRVPEDFDDWDYIPDNY